MIIDNYSGNNYDKEHYQIFDYRYARGPEKSPYNRHMDRQTNLQYKIP